MSNNNEAAATSTTTSTTEVRLKKDGTPKSFRGALSKEALETRFIGSLDKLELHFNAIKTRASHRIHEANLEKQIIGHETMIKLIKLQTKAGQINEKAKTELREAKVELNTLTYQTERLMVELGLLSRQPAVKTLITEDGEESEG